MEESKRKFDIAIFGASGITGQYVIEEMARFHSDVKWCVAGRSVEKLRKILTEIGKLIGKSLDEINIIEADVSDKASLDAMCESSKLLINCVGPYRFSGEQIVDSCVKAKTHCVDVSGEPQFLETIQAKYFHEAVEKNIYIVGSCGFDSIPCDVGVEFLKKNFDGDLNSVETFMDVIRAPGSTINFATWQSAVHGLAHAHELKQLRKSLKEKVFNKEIPRSDYKIKKRPVLFHSNEVQGWCLPFIGSDKSVITRTQMFNYQFLEERPVQVQTYMKTYSLFYALVTMLMGGIFMLFSKYVLGRDLLEKFPEVFSLGVFSRIPPKRELAKDGSFSVMLVGKGWSEKLLNPADKHTEPPKKVMKAMVKGPDPGYVATSICIVNSALVVLHEKDKLPLNGGVFTPGSAFPNTTLLQRLVGRGITMKIQNS